MNIDAALSFKDSRAWRRWLEKNHDRETEAWLMIYKKRSPKPGLRYEAALEEALCFGWIDGKMQSRDADTFVLRFSPRQAGSIWSRRNREKAEQLMARGRMREAGLARIAEARDNHSWEAAYTSLEKDVIPDDLQTALAGDKAAWENFQNFANSYRNMYIAWVQAAKKEETRRSRIAEVVRRSLQNIKPGI